MSYFDLIKGHNSGVYTTSLLVISLGQEFTCKNSLCQSGNDSMKTILVNRRTQVVLKGFVLITEQKNE